MNFEIRVSGLDGMAKVVVNLPQGLGRFGVENATAASAATLGFEWYLKNHLGSTMLVYGTGSGSGSVRAALPRLPSFLRNSLPLPPSEGPPKFRSKCPLLTFKNGAKKGQNEKIESRQRHQRCLS